MSVFVVEEVLLQIPQGHGKGAGEETHKYSWVWKNCALYGKLLPLVLDILLARLDSHIAQLDDFLQPLLQVLDVALLLGHELPGNNKIGIVSTTPAGCKQKMEGLLTLLWLWLAIKIACDRLESVNTICSPLNANQRSGGVRPGRTWGCPLSVYVDSFNLCRLMKAVFALPIEPPLRRPVRRQVFVSLCCVFFVVFVSRIFCFANHRFVELCSGFSSFLIHLLKEFVFKDK